MRYYIDTNVLIGFLEKELPSEIINIIDDTENLIYISSASVQEFIHLIKLDKIRVNKTFSIFGFIEKDLNFQIKFVSKEHIKKLIELDIAEEHNDPTDQIIISQAITEKIQLISSDQKFKKYEKQGLKLISYKRK